MDTCCLPVSWHHNVIALTLEILWSFGGIFIFLVFWVELIMACVVVVVVEFFRFFFNVFVSLDC